MTEEEMAEEYVDTLLNKDDSELDKLLDENLGDLELNKKQAGTLLGIIKGVGICSYLAGLKAGRPEWHKVADRDLPKENQECYFIYSNTYGNFNKVSFAKSNIQVRTGVYSFFLDDEGNQTTEPCFYDDIIGDEIDLSEVYAWKEIVLPELKESE